MKFQLLLTGATADKYINEGIKEYEKRLKRYVPFEIEILRDLKNTKNLSFDQVKQKESDQQLKFLEQSSFVILLDENGKEFTSVKFADYIDKLMIRGLKTVTFVVGGPYGFSPEMYQRADAKISLSKMTFSHQMVRLFFTEQLYRAFTILKNEPYHHQ